MLKLRDLVLQSKWIKYKIVNEGRPITGHEGPRGGRWSAPRPGRFTPGKDPVPVVQEAGWAPGPVWTGAKNLVPTGIFFFHVKSLYYQSCHTA
jgi:hypothetical protein